jgi:hypothetical protein
MPVPAAGSSYQYHRGRVCSPLRGCLPIQPILVVSGVTGVGVDMARLAVASLRRVRGATSSGARRGECRSRPRQSAPGLGQTIHTTCRSIQARNVAARGAGWRWAREIDARGGGSRGLVPLVHRRASPVAAWPMLLCTAPVPLSMMHHVTCSWRSGPEGTRPTGALVVS